VWAGQPIAAHWGVPDPGNTPGSDAEIERAFRDTFVTLDRRIGLFLSLPLASLSALAIKKALARIARK
jgi:arsenate reductase